MSKRLEIDYIRIKDVQFGEKTSLKDGVLTVNKQELIDIAASELFGSLDIQLAKLRRKLPHTRYSRCYAAPLQSGSSRGELSGDMG